MLEGENNTRKDNTTKIDSGNGNQSSMKQHRSHKYKQAATDRTMTSQINDDANKRGGA